MKIKAYAKINLSLDVTGRREDGFHTLDTVMQSVTLYDEVELKREKEPGVRLRCSKDYLPTDKRNTAYRAAQFFLEHCGITEEGVSLSIRKRIPSRAGMGGGSADAAAVLLGLDQLFETHLGLPALMELGARVGADVPFCVHGGTCRCTGIGEVVEPVAPMPHCYLAICKPPAGMSTPRAYALLDDYPQTRNFGTPRMLSALEKGDLGRVAAALSNRFDETMRLTQVRQIKRMMLAAGALGAMMTGSGSAVYGLFDTKEKAENCLGVLEGRGKLYLCSPCAGGAEPLE